MAEFGDVPAAAPAETGVEGCARLLDGVVASGRLRRDVEFLAAGPRSRVRAPAGMERAEAHVIGQLRQAGWRVDRQDFEARWKVGTTDRPGRTTRLWPLRLHRRLVGANLVAQLPGHPDVPTVVIGAHLDTVDGSPGADDNASGVAVLLELGRLLGRCVVPPPVTLVFFDMEELGGIGARVAVGRLLRGRALAGMVCLESVGFFAPKPYTQRLPAGAGLVFRDVARTVRAGEYRADFVLVACRRSSQMAALRWGQAAAATRVALRSVLVRDRRPDGRLGQLIGLAVPPMTHLGRSDHGPFWNRGIPALMPTGTAEFRNHRYHRPTDTPETLDYDRLAAVTVATAATALQWPGTG